MSRVLGDLRSFEIEAIHIPRGRRGLNADRVEEIAASIAHLGLMSPPLVTMRDVVHENGEEWLNTPVLIAGRHRMEALTRLGHQVAGCIVVNVDDVDAELMEISENLHRSELTALQRDEQVARWIALTSTRANIVGESIKRQADAKVGRPEGGVRAAARELGLSEADARRAVKVASLSPEAKSAALLAKADGVRSVLLSAAAKTAPKEQVAVIEAWDAQRENAKAKAALQRKKAHEVSDKQFGLGDGIEESISTRAQELASEELLLAHEMLTKMRKDYSDLLHENFNLKTELDLLKKKLFAIEARTGECKPQNKTAIPA